MEKYYLQENNNSIEIRDRNVSEMWAHLAAVDIKAGQNMVLHRSKDKEDTSNAHRSDHPFRQSAFSLLNPGGMGIGKTWNGGICML